MEESDGKGGEAGGWVGRQRALSGGRAPGSRSPARRTRRVGRAEPLCVGVKEGGGGAASLGSRCEGLSGERRRAVFCLWERAGFGRRAAPHTALRRTPLSAALPLFGGGVGASCFCGFQTASPSLSLSINRIRSQEVAGLHLGMRCARRMPLKGWRNGLGRWGVQPQALSFAGRVSLKLDMEPFQKQQFSKPDWILRIFSRLVLGLFIYYVWNASLCVTTRLERMREPFLKPGF